MSEELRLVRDTLIEELRRSETLTVAGRALFARYAAMSEAATGTAPAEPDPAQPGPAPAPPPAPATRRRVAPVDEDEEFSGSFMVRSNAPQPNVQGYHDTSSDLPRSLRERRR